MTFYWWSHWFWITLLCNLILPQIVIVHTYPSQESIQEYNHNQENNLNNVVTKLHHSSTVLSWTTESSISTKSTTTQDTLIHDGTEQDSSATLVSNNEAEEEYYYDEDTTEDDINQKINLEQVDAELESKENTKDISENDVKRSAEIINKATSGTKIENKVSITPATQPVIAEANNYTNFTQQTLALSTNTTTTTTATTALNTTTTRTTTITTNNTNNTSDSSDNNTPTTTQIATHEAGLVNDTTTLLPQAPASPRIVKEQTGKSEWLNTAQFPPAHLTTDDGSRDYPEDDHKIPFTLENVSEHRSRKSKVLSADYKVNRYINYSTDSKNHLTRSTTEFEEPNISSERLSVQPTYFKDVGAISAICFTVFGICCTVGTVGIVLYRRRFLNKPQALSEPDSSVYIDDSTMRVSVSTDNSDEMYSLDNDSFLNSLEAMTIQNYWTDTVKHTKL